MTADLGDLERAWRASGALADETALLAARLGAGRVTEEALRAAAYLGSPAARAVLADAEVAAEARITLGGLCKAARPRRAPAATAQDAEPTLAEVRRLAGGKDAALDTLLDAAGDPRAGGKPLPNALLAQIALRITSAALHAHLGDDAERLMTLVLGLTTLPGVETARTLDAELLARANIALARAELDTRPRPDARELAKLRRMLGRGIDPETYEAQIGSRHFELAEGALPPLLLEAAVSRVLGEPVRSEGSLEYVLDAIREEHSGVESAHFRTASAAFSLSRQYALSRPAESGSGAHERLPVAALPLVRAELVPWLLGHRDPLRGSVSADDGAGPSTTYLEVGTKFWEITVAGATHVARWGKLGNAGQTKTTTFPSAAAARDDAALRCAEKQRKGYAPRPVPTRVGDDVVGANPDEALLAKVKGVARKLLERVLSGELARERLILAAWLEDRHARKAAEASGADLRDLPALLPPDFARRAFARAAVIAVRLALEPGEREAGAPLAAARRAMEAVAAWAEDTSAPPADLATFIESAENEGVQQANARHFSASAACRAAAQAAEVPAGDVRSSRRGLSMALGQAANARMYATPEAERPVYRERTLAFWADVCAQLLPWALDASGRSAR